MAIIGNLSIGMRMGTAALAKDTKQARGLLGGITDSVMSMKGALVGAGAAIGVGVLVAKFGEMASAQAENVAQTTRLAQRIGTTTEALGGLQYAAKTALGLEDVESFGDALSDMREKIGDVTTEAGGAAEVLKMLDLDADQLAGQDAAENFKQIADKISGLQSQADKLHIADTLFGGMGQQMLPLLDQGSAGIEAMQAKAKELGLTFNEFEAGSVVKAQAAVGELTARFEGLANQVVIQVAPFVSGLIDKISEFGSAGFSASQIVSTGLEWTGKSLGVVADVLDVVHDGFGFVMAAAQKWFAIGLSGWSYIGKAIQDVLNLLPGVEVQFADTISAMADEMHKLAGEQFDQAMKDFTAAPPSEGITSFFDDIQDSSLEAANSIVQTTKAIDGTAAATLRLSQGIEDLQKSLKEQIDTFGMSSVEADIFKLKMQGAADEQLANVRALADQLKAKEKLKELEDKAKDVIESTRTPLEEFEAKLSELQTLRTNGLLDSDQFQRAVDAAKGDIGDFSPKFASVAELGSQEARSSILRHQFGGLDDPQKEAAKTAKAQLEQAKLLPPLLKTIASKLGVEEVFDF